MILWCFGGGFRLDFKNKRVVSRLDFHGGWYVSHTNGSPHHNVNENRVSFMMYVALIDVTVSLLAGSEYHISLGPSNTHLISNENRNAKNTTT